MVIFACSDNNPNRQKILTEITMSMNNITIVADNITAYKIFFPVNATKSERFAAEELKTYIYRITDVLLPIESENEPYGKIISIGNTALMRSVGINADENKLNGDGFIIKKVDDTLFFAAATDRGIVYSVYHFLEKYCGVRFLNVDEEYVPKTSKLCLNVYDEVNVPSFKYRAHLSDVTYHTTECRGIKEKYKIPIPIFYAQTRSTHEFIYFNKGKDVGKTDEFFNLVDTVGGGIPLDVSINPTHNNLTYVSPDKYLATDEQRATNSHMFFILNDKVRDIRYSDGIAEDGSIIDGVNTASVYLESLKSQILSNPDAVYFNCGQEDLKEYDETGIKNDVTYTVLRFYNAIAKAIKKWAENTIPERKIRIVIFAYLFTKEAPSVLDDSVILCDNIVLRFADLFSNTTYPLTSEYCYRPEAYPDLKFGPDYFEKWKPFIKNCAEIWYWGYATNHTFYYFYQPVIQKVKPLLTELKDLGVSYVLLQNNTTERNDWKAIIDNYVCSKMLWDVSLNPYELRKEFISLYYGIIADDVLNIVNGFDTVVKELDEKCDHLYYGKIYSFYPNDRIKEDVVEKGFDKDFIMADFCEKTLFMLDEMQTKVEKSSLFNEEKAKLLKRIDMIRLTPYYILAFYRDYLYGKDVFRTKYFKSNKDGFSECTNRFFALCDKLEVYDAGEAKKPEWHKKLFNIN